ncbi:DUF2865 domain-containing protein [Pelagibacterium xiamenense]|uniref:DUF2865 domain-containing protein n=1 Tax=Pelagibacterium xiamenense TaxID=2901140 RepID=UPI001E4B46F8|nr:DUF2865 domain-containing protein [Pelagibacterium xiamenense]MCD7059608.1 DUF2865 domain-containing protein [Pelagibacterium xiamenense]
MMVWRRFFAKTARFTAVGLMGAAIAAGTSAAALAQNRNCTQITSMLQGIERNAAYTDLNTAAAQLQNAQARVREAESQWVRGGCQEAYNAGLGMTSQCRSLAQAITGGRSDVQELTNLVREGQSLAQGRESLLQDYARFSCGSDQSGVSFATRGNPAQPQRRSLLDQMFGDPQQGGYDYIENQNPWSNMATRRTVCVRTSDGFYWPISFSTVDAYITQDAIKCHESCPEQSVLLFSYRNPGEEPEDMISLSGARYTSMPYAFAFRQNVDLDASCRPEEPTGAITLTEGDGGTRPMIAFGDERFPLPLRDPRERTEAVVAEANFVPLPRPRPNNDGTLPEAVTAQSGTTAADLNIVTFDGKPVRIVGPVTPYVPGAAGSS